MRHSRRHVTSFDTPGSLMRGPGFFMDTQTRASLIAALERIKQAKQRLEEAQLFLVQLMTDLSAPVVPNARLDMSGLE